VKDSTASTSSNTSEESSSSASSVEGDKLTTQSDDAHENSQRKIKYGWDDLEENLYDLDLMRFEEDEFTQEFYNRSVYIKEIILCTL